MKSLAPLLAISGSTFGAQFFDVTNFGAVGDGKTLNTIAIQQAVDAAAAAGGGVVAIPAGTYISGTIELKDHVTFLVGEGALLRGSDNLEDYPPIPFEHNELGKTRSLLWAIGRKDVRIAGAGTIDLNDQPFMDWNSLPAGPLDTGIPLNERQKGEATVKHLPRPTQPIFFHNCERIRISGVTFLNAPCWTITASVSRDIRITDITIDNNLQAPNSDGLHFCGSKDIVVTGCVFSAGDDCIAVTGITAWDEISENIVIADCTMRSRSSAIRFGHQASKVRNVVVSNLTIHDSNRGIAIFAGNNGWVEDVVISNIVSDTRIIAGGWWGKGEPLVMATSGSGTITGVSISQVRAKSDQGIIIVGQDGSIRDVLLRDWTLKTRIGNNRELFKHLFDLQPAPLVASPDPSKHIPGIFAQGVNGLAAYNVRVTSESPVISSEAIIENSTGVRLVDCEFASADNPSN